jgi:hypothetical protein
MKLIIITIIKHHNSKHYIHSIFINTYDNYLCLLEKYRFKISRMLTKHFQSELFDECLKRAKIIHFHAQFKENSNNLYNVFFIL